MDKWRGIKCEPGYIDRQKVFQSVMLLVFVAAGFGLFLIGFLLTKTRANVFTVLGILMVLPAAKRVISLVVMLPRHSVERERFDRMREALEPGAVLLTDYVFTSSDKIMNLDFVIIQNQRVIGIGPEQIGRSMDRWEKNKQYMEDYLQKSVAGIAPDYQVELLVCDADYYERYGDSDKVDKASSDPGSQPGGADEIQGEIVKYLKILAV